MRRQRIATATLVASVLATLLAAAPAEAADTRTYRITNNTGAPASDLHVTFSGTGGDLTTVVVVNPPGCPPPAIPSNGRVTNRMVLDWKVDCVRPGAAVVVRVSTVNGPLQPVGGFWTSRRRPQEPGSGPVHPQEDVEELADGGDGPRLKLSCCQYLCRDAKSAFLLVSCVDGACPQGVDGCRSLDRYQVDSCKECLPRVDRGEGGGDDPGYCGKPGEKGDPGAPPDGGGGTGGGAKAH